MKTLRYAINHRQADVSRTQAIWIWFWYSDLTRLVFPLLGLHLLLTLLLGSYLVVSQNLSVEVIRYGLMVQYLSVFLWAMYDNDYENLHKIGLSVYRRPL